MSQRYRTGDQALVREINLSLIMQRLWEHQLLSRAALADVTGLNKSTVSSLVNELLDMQFAHEVGLSSRGVGRPSMMLELNPSAGMIVSCEIGVDFLFVICANFGAEIIWQHHETTPPDSDQQTILNRVLLLLRDAVNAGRERCSECGEMLGMAVGVPAITDHVSGTVLFAPNLKWKNVPLRAILSDTFAGMPIFVENEANLAALGEYFFGAARGCDEVLYISAGVGLGGAVVRHGRLFRGKTGFASEFGHMTMDPNGALCSCGNYGCWETQVSQATLFRHIQQADEARAAQPLTMDGITEAARAGDPIARAALEQVGSYLGIGIASLINALNPDRVVFGGILSAAGDFLLPVIERELERRALPWSRAATQVVLAEHRANACALGGVATAFQAILLEPGRYRPVAPS